MDWSVQLLQQEADATAALVAADMTPGAGDDGVGEARPPQVVQNLPKSRSKAMSIFWVSTFFILVILSSV